MSTYTSKEVECITKQLKIQTRKDTIKMVEKFYALTPCKTLCVLYKKKMPLL